MSENHSRQLLPRTFHQTSGHYPLKYGHKLITCTSTYIYSDRCQESFSSSERVEALINIIPDKLLIATVYT